MDLPIRFPSEEEAIREDVARFRELTPSQQIAELDGVFALYHHLRSMSGRAAQLDRFAAEAEADYRFTVMRLAERYGRP